MCDAVFPLPRESPTEVERWPQGPASHCCPSPSLLTASLPLTLWNAGGSLSPSSLHALPRTRPSPVVSHPLGNFPGDSSPPAPLHVPAPASGLSSNTWEAWSCQKETKQCQGLFTGWGLQFLAYAIFYVRKKKNECFSSSMLRFKVAAIWAMPERQRAEEKRELQDSICSS